eukprot:GHVU01208949.1.p1 GENE.GHVU01208949.1~~GHVU01208949.1.p1  ORF type:complete len:113 (+),score=10.70 GHVU01208949.1:240-578(+)
MGEGGVIDLSLKGTAERGPKRESIKVMIHGLAWLARLAALLAVEGLLGRRRRAQIAGRGMRGRGRKDAVSRNVEELRACFVGFSLLKYFKDSLARHLMLDRPCVAAQLHSRN